MKPPYVPHNRYVSCTTFDFARSDWTLHWKQTYSACAETSQCRHLYEGIRREKKVKWIVFPNKTKLNLGCKDSNRKFIFSRGFDFFKSVFIIDFRGTKFFFSGVNILAKISNFFPFLFLIFSSFFSAKQ